MKHGSWATGFLFRGFGCRCWANLCGVDAHSISKRTRDIEREFEENVGTLEEGGWTGAVDENNAPVCSSTATHPQSEEMAAGSMNLSNGTSMPQKRLEALDEHMQELRNRHHALIEELQKATSERHELIMSLDDAHGPAGSQMDGDVQRLDSHVSLATDYCDGESSTSRKGSNSQRMLSICRTEGIGHFRQDSSCNPDSGGSGDEIDRQIDGVPPSSNGDAEGMNDREMFEHMLEMGDGEFVMDDELDDITDVDLNGLDGRGDLPTPRAIPHPDAFGLDMLVDEDGAGVLEELNEVGVLGSGDQFDDDQGVDVANPPFSPMDGQAQCSSSAWDDFGDGFNDEDPCTWLSNKTFGGSTGSGGSGPIDHCEEEEESNIQFRTTHVALLERANRANSLACELTQTRLALEDAQSQLEFTTERMIAYKKYLQSEQVQHAEVVTKYKVDLDEATSSKFIMFCRLQQSQDRIEELEKDIARLRQEHEREECHGGSLEDDAFESGLEISERMQSTVEQREEDISPEGSTSPHVSQGMMASSSTNSGAVRGGSVQGQTSAANNHPLHEALSRALRQLLDAEARGDRLQRQVDLLQAEVTQRKIDTSTQAATQQTGSSPPPQELHDVTKVEGCKVRRLRSRLLKKDGNSGEPKEGRKKAERCRKFGKEIKSAEGGECNLRGPRWR